MPDNVTRKLIAAHLVPFERVPSELADGDLSPGTEIALRIDQTLTQDATGTLVMLELEALGLDRVKTELSAQYVDHNLIQSDHKNPDDHLFLRSACRRWGIQFSRAGGGVSHPVHMQRFGKPGKTLLGSDSHTPAAGSLGMLAIGAGGLDVALAMAGEPYALRMPEVWGIRLTGALPPWVSAKDVILELLRRHGVSGGKGRVLEYHGPGLAGLSAMDRHVIANMGTELGATSTVFPSDAEVRRYLEAQGRGEDWTELVADEGATFDVEEEIDLGSLEPLIARPSSPGDVVPVAEVAGEPIYQAYVGSSANPGFRDFAICALALRGKEVHPEVSFDVNPTSRQLLDQLLEAGLLVELVRGGGRLHQAGCNGCIGMGQAPATGRNSLRTTPRNFPGRSGTVEDSVWLCSPETAIASALTGVITDPRTLGDAPDVPDAPLAEPTKVEAPPEDGRDIPLNKGPNIVSLPELDPLPERLELPVLLAVGDDISTDEIMPAGSEVLPFRSNIPKIAEFCFGAVDETYPARAREASGGHALVGGDNYGQGSSREHAALAPRHLGLRLVLARSFARIHRNNLVNYGVLPLRWEPGDIALEQGDVLVIDDLASIGAGPVKIEVRGKGAIEARSDLSPREVEMIRVGGRIPQVRARVASEGGQ